MKWDDLKFSVCNSSAVTFALQMTRIDVVLALTLAAVAGVSAFAWGDEVAALPRAALALLAAISAYSLFVTVRVLVPFVMNLSFADMLRLRISFCLWIVSLVAVAGLCGLSELFSTLNTASMLLTLLFASVMLTLRFFQNGSLLRLGLAFSCAGGAVGLSALGILAPVTTLVLLWFMARKLLSAHDATDWEDQPHPKVVAYFRNPLVHARVRWLFVGCFFACVGGAFCYLLHGAGDDPSSAVQAWIGRVGAKDAAFLLLTAILPLVIGVVKAGSTSDVNERTGFGCLPLYMVIAPISAALLLRADLFLSLLGSNLRIEANVLALASVVYMFNLLLAGIIILADIRCRDYRSIYGIQTDNLRGAMRISYAFFNLAPLALLAFAIFLSLKFMGTATLIAV